MPFFEIDIPGGIKLSDLDSEFLKTLRESNKVTVRKIKPSEETDISQWTTGGKRPQVRTTINVSPSENEALLQVKTKRNKVIGFVWLGEQTQLPFIDGESGKVHAVLVYQSPKS